MNALLKLILRELTSDAMSAEPRYPVRPAMRTYPVVRSKAQVLVLQGHNERFPDIEARWLRRGYLLKLTKACNLQLVEVQK